MASVFLTKLVESEALTDSFNSARKSIDLYHKDFVGYIKATNVHAATTVDAEIQHSPDGIDWHTFAAFTDIVGAAGSEVLQITASVLPWIRANVALSGATKQATVTVSLYSNTGK